MDSSQYPASSGPDLSIKPPPQEKQSFPDPKSTRRDHKPLALRQETLGLSSVPKSMSTGKSRDADLRLTAVPDKPASDTLASAGALVEFAAPAFKEEEEDLEVKLRRIIENVPVRVSNTSGSSAGSGSGDFHQYRQMRRREQDRLSRMDVDYQKRKEMSEFIKRREERLTAAEERTAKKRLKRQKKKQKKKEEKKLNSVGEGDPEKEEESSYRQ